MVEKDQTEEPLQYTEQNDSSLQSQNKYIRTPISLKSPTISLQ